MSVELPDLARVRCAWVTPVLGVDGNLLYLGPLLRRLAKGFGSFVVVTGEFIGDAHTAGFAVERCGGFWRMYRNERATVRQVAGYRRGVGFATPAVLLRFLREPVDLLIITEFSLYACYAALATLIVSGTRILWVVEARPRPDPSRVLAALRRLTRRLLAKLADAFITNNEEGGRYLASELRVDARRIVVSPFLVSDTSTGRRRSPRRVALGEPIRFLYVGQLIHRKGVRVALEALREVSDRTRAPFSLEIVGDGPERVDLEGFAMRHGIAHLVTFRGRVPYDEIDASYASAHVFIFPTLSDYRALAPFEALSSGLPIIASHNDGGIAETVDPGRNGFSFDPRHPVELANHIEYFIRNPHAIAAFSARSLEMAKAYTLESAMKAMQTAASAALSQRCSSSR